mgnify:CR=1 FL=1
MQPKSRTHPKTAGNGRRSEGHGAGPVPTCKSDGHDGFRALAGLDRAGTVKPIASLADLPRANRLVIKVGSALLVEQGRPRSAWLATLATEIAALRQSTQPSRTAGVSCMVGWSVRTWQEKQPSDFAAICASVWMRGAGAAVTRL